MRAEQQLGNRGDDRDQRLRVNREEPNPDTPNGPSGLLAAVDVKLGGVFSVSDSASPRRLFDFARVQKDGSRFEIRVVVTERAGGLRINVDAIADAAFPEDCA